MRCPLVTYHINAFNGAGYIEEAIASVLCQTYPNIELIVVDDGSTDETPEILARIRDPRVRVLLQPNMGSGFGSNRAKALARGEYIGALGQDDVLLPEKTERQFEAMGRQDWDFCFTWVEVIDAQGNPTEHHVASLFNQPTPSQAWALARLAHGNYLCAPTGLSRRHCSAALSSNVGLLYAGDYYRWLYLLSRFRFGVLERALVRYRVHESNLSYDDRYTAAYRAFELRAARALAVLEADPTRPRPFFWTGRQVEALRRQAEWLMRSGDEGMGLSAYLLANRALNLAPFDAHCYQALSQVLSWLGYEYPAALIAARGERVGEVTPYPLPTIPSPARRLYRRARSLADRATGGGWRRLETKLLNRLDRLSSPGFPGVGRQ